MFKIERTEPSFVVISEGPLMAFSWKLLVI